MLQINITRVCNLRGITRTFTLLSKNGISRNIASRLASGTALSISFKHLEKICIALNCTPNDLLQWIPGTGEKDTANHPLHPLRKDTPLSGFKELLDSLPIEKLNDIAKIINDKK